MCPVQRMFDAFHEQLRRWNASLSGSSTSEEVGMCPAYPRTNSPSDSRSNSRSISQSTRTTMSNWRIQVCRIVHRLFLHPVYSTKLWIAKSGKSLQQRIDRTYSVWDWTIDPTYLHRFWHQSIERQDPNGAWKTWSILTLCISTQNTLTGTIPTELAKLINLRTLSLNNNKLTGTIPTELAKLINLNSLFLNTKHVDWNDSNGAWKLDRPWLFVSLRQQVDWNDPNGACKLDQPWQFVAQQQQVDWKRSQRSLQTWSSFTICGSTTTQTWHHPQHQVWLEPSANLGFVFSNEEWPTATPYEQARLYDNEEPSARPLTAAHAAVATSMCIPSMSNVNRFRRNRSWTTQNVNIGCFEYVPKMIGHQMYTGAEKIPIWDTKLGLDKTRNKKNP